MALSTQGYAVAKETLSIIDYAGVPVTNAVTYYIVGSFSGPVVDEVASTEIMRASATGAVRHGDPVQGLAGGQTGSFQFWRQDIENDTDKNPESLLRGLAINSVAATGHSTETYTNQQAGGGKLQCKLSRVLTDEAGNTATETYPVIVKKVSEVQVNDARALQVDWELKGAITRA